MAIAAEPAGFELISSIVRYAAWVVFHMFIGLGPGFIFGIILANRIWGHGQPTHMEVHRENINRASEHNKQWHPSESRWQK